MSYQSGQSAMDEREQLILEHLPQVRLIARRIHERLPESVNLEDLVSTGVVGLISAIDRFDSSHNVKLKTYAEYKIRGAILDSLRGLDWAPRQQRKKAKQIESAIAKAEQKFTAAFTKAKTASCPTAATVDGTESAVDAISGRVVRDTLAAPEAGDGSYVTITPGATEYQGRTFNPVCMNGSPYSFFARRGTVNKLVMYYQGGGACWEQLTCSIPVCDDSVEAGDNPNGFSSGFASEPMVNSPAGTGTIS